MKNSKKRSFVGVGHFFGAIMLAAASFYLFADALKNGWILWTTQLSTEVVIIVIIVTIFETLFAIVMTGLALWQKNEWIKKREQATFSYNKG
jgi:uncharacterized membrane protein (DUF485 family)